MATLTIATNTGILIFKIYLADLFQVPVHISVIAGIGLITFGTLVVFAGVWIYVLIIRDKNYQEFQEFINRKTRRQDYDDQ